MGADFTIEAWIKPATATANAPVVSIPLLAATARAPCTYDGGRFRGMADMSSQLAELSRSAAHRSTPLAWHHVVFSTQGGAVLRLYVDGAFRGRQQSPAGPGLRRQCVVGWSSDLAAALHGTVDEVALYTSALSGRARQRPLAVPGRPRVASALYRLLAPGTGQRRPSGATLTVPACVYRETVTSPGRSP